MHRVKWRLDKREKGPYKQVDTTRIIRVAAAAREVSGHKTLLPLLMHSVPFRFV